MKSHLRFQKIAILYHKKMIIHTKTLSLDNKLNTSVFITFGFFVPKYRNVIKIFIIYVNINKFNIN